MTFTLPPTGEGPSIEAEVSGMEIVFPAGLHLLFVGFVQHAACCESYEAL